MGVTNIRPVWFTVTFCDEHALENVDGMLTTDFMGIGKTYRLDNPHTVSLRPFPELYEVAIATLEEMREFGILTFVEKFR
jgi:hypothetical protein